MTLAVMEEIFFWIAVAGVIGAIIWLACCADNNKGGMYDD